MKQLPKGATLNMLFHGAPDIMVGAHPMIVCEGVIETNIIG